MNCIDKEVAEKLSKEVSSYIIEQVKHNMDKSIEERAILNLQYEKDFLGRNLSDNMVLRAYERGAKEQKAIENNKACEWLRARNALTEASLEGFRNAMEEQL